MGRAISQQELEDRSPLIVELWLAGRTVKEIRSQAQCAEKTIKRVLDLAASRGLDISRKMQHGGAGWNKKSDPLREQVREMYLRGDPLSEIASAAEMTKGQVSGLVKRMGLKRPEGFNRANLAAGSRKAQATKRERGQTHASRPVRDQEADTLTHGVKREPTRSRYVATPQELAQAKTILDLGYGDCRFPINHPEAGQGETTLFCGKRAAGSYCLEHEHLCTRQPRASEQKLAPAIKRFAA